MSVPERFDGQRVSGDNNQVIDSVRNSTVFGDVGGNVTIEAAKRVTSPFQLPRNVADFTGRVDELALIEAALTATDGTGAVAISAVAGMAGVGKSALAICAAYKLKARFPDAQLYVNLQGVDARPRDPGDVLGEWLRALGMDGAEIPVDLHERQACFRSLLANQRALVVLDNAHDEAQVRPLLPGGAGCGVIVTSRKLLAALPGTKNLTLKMLPPLDALALLAKMAGESRVAAEQAAAEEIVRLCGYLPLAVEIAGGLLKGRADWSLAVDYLPKLRDERGRLDALRQEQGNDVRAIFNVSYRQLGEAEQRLFALLGTLPGEFGDGVMMAVSELSDEETAAGLDRLIEAQLVEALGERRYRYHDLMRLYAREWLEPDDGFAAMERAFEWYWEGANYWNSAFYPRQLRALVTQINKDVVNELAEQEFLQTALEWFETERTNLLTAFDWLSEQKRHQDLIYFAGSLAGFFEIRSYWQDEENICLLALLAAKTSKNKRSEGYIVNALGNVYNSQGRWDEAITQYQQSLEVCRSIGNLNGEGHALHNLANVYQTKGRWDEAIAQYQQSLEIFRSMSDRYNEGKSLTGLGLVYKSQGRWSEAIAQHLESLEICRSLGDRHGEGKSLGNLGNAYRSQGLWDKAITHCQQSLDIYLSMGDRHGESLSLIGLGMVYDDQGRWDEAIAQYYESLEIFRSLGDRHGEGTTLMNLGMVYQSQGRWDEAIAQYEQSLEICRALSDRHGEGKTLNNLGMVYQSQGRWDEAITQYEQSLEIFRALGDRHGEGTTLMNLGMVYQSQGRWDEAITQYEQSLEIFRALGDRHGEGATLNNLGNVYQSQGRWDEAIAQYEQSLEICRALSDRHGEGKTLNNLGGVYQSQGHWEEAITHYQQSLEISCALGDRHGEGNTLNNLGEVYKSQSRWDEAIAQYEQSLEIFRDLGDRYGEGTTLMNLGNVYQSQGRWDEAIAQYEQSLERYRALGDRHGEGQTLTNLGNLYQARAQPFKAQEHWQAALTKLHPDSPEAKRLTQQLENPFSQISPKQFLIGCAPQLALLLFAAVNLLRGHWAIAALTLFAFASLITYRLWKLRRGN